MSAYDPTLLQIHKTIGTGAAGLLVEVYTYADGAPRARVVRYGKSGEPRKIDSFDAATLRAILPVLPSAADAIDALLPVAQVDPEAARVAALEAELAELRAKLTAAQPSRSAPVKAAPASAPMTRAARRPARPGKRPTTADRSASALSADDMLNAALSTFRGQE